VLENSPHSFPSSLEDAMFQRSCQHSFVFATRLKLPSFIAWRNNNDITTKFAETREIYLLDPPFVCRTKGIKMVVLTTLAFLLESAYGTQFGIREPIQR
jgi:hypothetical protein